ncbi:sodium:solute symporter family domain-containing protein [Phthorimaea operculella]|nr:sodium:solute symporter family domain-containing protein [Phthorimaea operculella]
MASTLEEEGRKDSPTVTHDKTEYLHIRRFKSAKTKRKNLIANDTSYKGYLELRFNRHVRAIASILFLLDEVLFLPMVIYVPALAFNQLTGFSVYAIGAVMVVICGLYTVLGGLRAVVWTDSVQTGIMYVGVIMVGVAGTFAVGGFKRITETAYENGRLDIKNWSFSPYERQTGWGAIVGGGIYWTCFNSVNQTMVQRYLSLATQKKARQAMGIFCVGVLLAICVCVWCGLAAWTAWATTGCVPSGSPLVNDRLLPAFVTYVSSTQKLPGLAGVFLAGVFGAGLSSLSAVLNACALVAVEDILRGWLRVQWKPLKIGIFARLFTAILAVVSVLMLLVISKLGGVLGVATALSAIAASTTCGIFTLGMCCWWVGPRGAIAGGVAGALVAGTVSLGSQAAAASGLRAPAMPFNDACAANATFVPIPNDIDPTTIFPLFRLSYHWIAPLGLLVTLTVGAIVGWLFDKDTRKLDEELFTPCVWRWLPPQAKEQAGMYRRKFAERHEIHAALPLLLEPVIKQNGNKILGNGTEKNHVIDKDHERGDKDLDKSHERDKMENSGETSNEKKGGNEERNKRKRDEITIS